MGYRAGSEEVVDSVMDASSVYVASIFLSAYTGGSCSHISGTLCPLLPLLRVEAGHVSVKGSSNLDLGPPSGV